MERLETKQIHDQTYYYYFKWGWVDGKCRRMWQKEEDQKKPSIF